MEDKTLGMRWFKIYTVLFAVRVAIIAVSLVITIPLTIKNGLPSDSIEAARTVVYSIDYAFAIFAFIHFIKKTKARILPQFGVLSRWVGGSWNNTSNQGNRSVNLGFRAILS